METKALAFSLLTVCCTLGCGDTPPVATDDTRAPVLSPEEEQATFALKPGYRIELVAAEPLVEDPVVVTFDEDGRLWVVEMRGFMPDIDAEGEDAPVGRISILFDDDEDGRMDRRHTFLDSLVLPRALAVVNGGALVAENLPLWFVEDRDGDLVADRKTLIDPEYGGSGLPEHSANGLWRGLDNWYYNAKSQTRYKRVADAWIQDETEFRGQWGISHDDKGRLYYNYNWSSLHADQVPPNALHRNPHHLPTSGLDVGLTVDRSVYPIRPNRAVNRGAVPGNLDEEGRLLEFTSASAPLVYRGAAMPELYGNVFVVEPAGNLVKRNVVHEDGFALTSSFAYPDSEFLASTDERFRPVSLAHGPDGALYVVDMYRGVIQHGAYMTPYLRDESLRRGLVDPIHKGRIWRIVPEERPLGDPIELSALDPAELVATLSHEDGWYRDTAQRLLVERDDPAALPLLRATVRSGASPLGRLHALWTLDGLGEADLSTYRHALGDSDPTVQAAAVRILGERAEDDPTARAVLDSALPEMWEDADPELAIQIALSAAECALPTRLDLLAGIVDRYADEPIMRDAVLSSLANQEYALLEVLWDAPHWQRASPGRTIFLEQLATAVTRKEDPAEIRGLLAKLEAVYPGPDWRANPLLSSLALYGSRTETPVRLASAPSVFTGPPAGDERRTALLNDAKSGFAWPGYSPERDPREATRMLDAEAQALFITGRQRYLTSCAGCHGTDGAGLRRFAPPLAGSEWVRGSEEILTRLVLHGIEGPIEVSGIVYDAPEILPVMPGHSVLDDRELASILTYIRNAWGNTAAPIDPSTVSRIRHGSQGRVVPWTAEELGILDF